MEKIQLVETPIGQKKNPIYAHQKRPDQDSRLKQVIPYNRLVKQQRKHFTTDTSSNALAPRKFNPK